MKYRFSLHGCFNQYPQFLFDDIKDAGWCGDVDPYHDPTESGHEVSFVIEYTKDSFEDEYVRSFHTAIPILIRLWGRMSRRPEEHLVVAFGVAEDEDVENFLLGFYDYKITHSHLSLEAA